MLFVGAESGGQSWCVQECLSSQFACVRGLTATRLSSWWCDRIVCSIAVSAGQVCVALKTEKVAKQSH